MAWREVLGHDSVVESFRCAVSRGRLGHSYLFTGPIGIGKATFALMLARAVLCESNTLEELDPCDECPGCIQAQAQTHPDLKYVTRDPAKHDLPIDSIRGAIRSLAFKPDRGRYKVCIIDDADLMNEYAANGFLKTLEEPPSRSLLILIGTNPERQLSTIRSRCQNVRFDPLSTDDVRSLLIDRELVESPEEASRLAELSRGSLHRALLLADPVYGEFREYWSASVMTGHEHAAGLSDRVIELIESAGKESALKRTRAKLLLSVATDVLHERLRTESDLQGGPNSGSDLGYETISRRIEACMKASYEVDRKVSVPLLIECWADAVAAD